MKPTMPKLSDGWMYVPISKETWELLSHFGNQEETADEGIKTALKIASRSSAKESSDVLDEKTVKQTCNYFQNWAKEYLKDNFKTAPPFTEWISIIGIVRKKPSRILELRTKERER